MSVSVLKLPENTKGRDFVVGDIHGCFHLLERAMTKISFDPAADRIISVGDLINRGPQSDRCLEFLQKPWFFSVRGNHERYFSKTFKNGYPSTSYERGGIEKTLHWVFNQNADYFKKLSEALAALPLAMEIATPQGPVGIVHGNVPRGMSWQHFTARISAGDKEVRGAATEGRSRITAGDLQGVTGIRHIFSGHTVQEQGPRALGNCFYIDTGAYQADLYPEKNYALTLADLRVTAEDINKSQNNRRDRCIIILPGGQKP